MNYLLETTEVYRVDSEKEVDDLIKEAKENHNYELVRYDRTQKELKSKGEVVDSWYRVSLKKRFTLEKEPELTVNIKYVKFNESIGEND